MTTLYKASFRAANWHKHTKTFFSVSICLQLSSCSFRTVVVLFWRPRWGLQQFRWNRSVSIFSIFGPRLKPNFNPFLQWDVICSTTVSKLQFRHKAQLEQNYCRFCRKLNKKTKCSHDPFSVVALKDPLWWILCF